VGAVARRRPGGAAAARRALGDERDRAHAVVPGAGTWRTAAAPLPRSTRHRCCRRKVCSTAHGGTWRSRTTRS
jgi:hypothetical protein